jgi:hypothetical protein
MSKIYGIAKCAGLLAVFGFMLSLGASLDSAAGAHSNGGKGYHTNAAMIAIHKTCAGINTVNPAFKQCVASYPKPDRFQKAILGGYSMD